MVLYLLEVLCLLVDLWHLLHPVLRLHPVVLGFLLDLVLLEGLLHPVVLLLHHLLEHHHYLVLQYLLVHPVRLGLLLDLVHLVDLWHPVGLCPLEDLWLLFLLVPRLILVDPDFL